MSYSIIIPWEEMEYPNNVGVIFTDSNFMINLGRNSLRNLVYKIEIEDEMTY